MKQQLALLRELQNNDLELDEILKSKQEIVTRIEENTGFLEKLVDDLSSQKEELGEVRTMHGVKKNDLVQVTEQLNMRQKRIHEVASTKEFNAVEKEIEAFKKSTEQSQEELIHMADTIAATEKSILQKEEKVVELRKGIAADKKDAESQLAELDSSIQRLENRCKEARGQVSKRVIYKYDFIRSRRPGLAIVAAKNCHCEGCFMQLPPQQYIEVQRGENMETCPSCNRILFFWEDDLPADSYPEEALEA